jgi:hypothetical protein
MPTPNEQIQYEHQEDFLPALQIPVVLKNRNFAWFNKTLGYSICHILLPLAREHRQDLQKVVL